MEQRHSASYHRPRYTLDDGWHADFAEDDDDDDDDDDDEDKDDDDTGNDALDDAGDADDDAAAVGDGGGGVRGEGTSRDSWLDMNMAQAGWVGSCHATSLSSR